jgi:hypothetical protein
MSGALTSETKITPPVGPSPEASTFVGECPQCKVRGLFYPETLYRSCLTAKPGDYASEPAKHLTRVESLDRYNNDPELDKSADVIFASTCSNPKCQKPIFLRVRGKKLEFAKIIRQRQGKPHGQSEEDLRLLELTLIETLPKIEPETIGHRWECSLELGPLCESLNRLAPEAIAKRDAVDVSSTCKTLVDALLLKLEAKRVIRDQVEWLARRERMGVFGFLMSLQRAMTGTPIMKTLAGHYARARSSGGARFDEQTLIDRLCFDWKTGEGDYLGGVRVEVEKELKRVRGGEKLVRQPTVSHRLRLLYNAGFVDRNMWRWAVRMELSAKAAGEDFYWSHRKQELSAFVRMLADSAFEVPKEILDTVDAGQEKLLKDGGRVPTKAP